ncbi:MAG: superoxide dismutase family protein [Betaproteobacteria bacterium]
MLLRSIAAAACLTLAACGGFDWLSTSIRGSGAGVQAVLKPVGGSSGRADATFVDRGNGVFMTIFLTNLPPGAYRVAIHRDSNCTSPNLFSAGPAWAPAGSVVAPQELLPVFRVDSNGDATLTAQVPGVRTTGPDSLQGRSVVLHAGTRVDEALPGVPNNRVLCGVIGAPQSFLS